MKITNLDNKKLGLILVVVGVLIVIVSALEYMFVVRNLSNASMMLWKAAMQKHGTYSMIPLGSLHRSMHGPNFGLLTHRIFIIRLYTTIITTCGIVLAVFGLSLLKNSK
jgi:hypothetical protein